MKSNIATIVKGSQIKDGAEWSPQQWLPQPKLSSIELKRFQQNVVLSVYQAASSITELADQALSDFGEAWSTLPNIPYGEIAPVEKFFDVLNGKSSGESNYPDGSCPYISSGDTTNSIIRLIAAEEDQIFSDGGITVTAFGQAFVPDHGLLWLVEMAEVLSVF